MAETTTTTTYVDKVLKCCEPDCKADFTWTAGEQEWFAAKQDPDSGKPFVPPRRCKTCRERKRAEREAQRSSR